MEALGIQPFLILGQIVNFAILVFVLKKFLYTPVLAMLDKRKAEIADGISRTKKMEDEESKLKDKQEKVLSDAKKEVRSLLDQAKKQAKEQEAQIVADAHKQAQEILAKAKAQAEQQMKASAGDEQKRAIELASQMVVKLVPGILSDSDHHKLIATHLKDLEKMSTRVN